MRVTFEVAFQALPPSLQWHCTDEAQKAETVLSAVIYILAFTSLLKCCYDQNLKIPFLSGFEK